MYEFGIYKDGSICNIGVKEKRKSGSIRPADPDRIEPKMSRGFGRNQTSRAVAKYILTADRVDRENEAEVFFVRCQGRSPTNFGYAPLTCNPL